MSGKDFLSNLYKYTVSIPDGTNGTAPNRNHSSPEDLQWLREAIGNLGSDPMRAIRACVKVLAEEEADTNLRLESLDTLTDYLEDVVFAHEFIKMNGQNMLLRLLNDTNENIRCKTCRLVSALIQNDELSQDAVFNTDGLFDKLLALITSDECTDVRTRALMAVLHSIRGYEPALKKFISQGGIKLIAETLNSPFRDVRQIAPLLVNAVGLNRKHLLIEENVIPPLIDIYITSEWNPRKHLALDAICFLISDNAQAQQQCRDLNFGTKLRTVLDSYKDKDAVSDEIATGEKIFRILG